jgi:hypothetical protein
VSMIDAYVDHIILTSNRSLLARIYGIFTLSTGIFPPIDFIIMQNTVQLESNDSKLLKFDLKGSKVDRFTKLNII